MELLAVLARWLVEFVVSDLLHLTGKILVLVLSLGRLRPAPLARSARGAFPTLGPVFTTIDGRTHVSPEAQILLGFLFYLALGLWAVLRFAA